MLHIEARHLKLIKEILAKFVPGTVVWAYGSRVHGENLKPFSDLDLVIISDESLPTSTITALHDAFSDSDLPWRIDLAEWSDLDPSFHSIILENHQVVYA